MDSLFPEGTSQPYLRRENGTAHDERKVRTGDDEYHLLSISKSRTSSFVSSVPLRLPTAQTRRVSSARILQTTPPLPPLSNETKLRMNSPAPEKKQIKLGLSKNTEFVNGLCTLPVFTSHNFTVPSSDEVITNLLLN